MSIQRGNRQAMVVVGFLVPGCGAFSGGQSGTDSLEAIGVVRPGTKCESAIGEGKVGDIVEREDACERCSCEQNGEWRCEPVPCTTSGAQAPGEETTASAESSPPPDQTEESAQPAIPESDASASPPDDECLTAIEAPSIGGSKAVYVAKDERAVVCLDPVTPTQLCMYGSTAASGEDFVYWGGGLGLVMSTSTDGGVEPFDATSLGIAGVRFTIDGVRPPFMVRAYLNQVDAPEITNPVSNFVQNSFVISELNENGVFALSFANAALPAWTNLDVNDDGSPDPDVPFDPAFLNSLQFFIAADRYTPFDFEVCISDVQWIDAAGEPVYPE